MANKQNFRNIGFYVNWAQFIEGEKYNSPSAYPKGLDRIIYAHLMFGVEPHPDLSPNTGCTYTTPPNANYGDLPHDPFLDSSSLHFPKENPLIWGTYMMLPNDCFTGKPPDLYLTDPECFKQLQKLKNSNPALKVMMSYGGWSWTHGGTAYSSISATKFHDMVSNLQSMQAFIKLSYEFITSYGFDGIDFDWKFPGQTLGTDISQNDAYMDFRNIEFLIYYYRKHVVSQGNPDFLITMQCSGSLSPDIVAHRYPDMLNDHDYYRWINFLLSNGLSEVTLLSNPNVQTTLSDPNLFNLALGLEDPDLSEKIASAKKRGLGGAVLYPSVAL